MAASKTIIGGELVGTVLRLVELDFTVNPVRTIRAAVADLEVADGRALAADFLSRIRAKEVALAVLDSAISHEILPDHNRLPLEFGQGAGAWRTDAKGTETSETEVGPAFNRGSGAGKHGNTRLVANCPTETLAGIRRVIESTGLKPGMLTSTQTALTYLLLSSGQTEQEGAVAIVHGIDATCVVVVADRSGPKVVRQIRLPSANPMSTDEKPTVGDAGRVECLVREVCRSVLYWQQHSPTLELTRIVVSGSAAEGGELAWRLEQTLEKEVTIFPGGTKFDEARIGDGGEADPSELKEFAGAIGATLALAGETENNFLRKPDSYRISRHAGAFVWTAAIVIWCCVVSLMYVGSSRKATNLKAQIEVATSVLSQVENEIVKAEELKQQRQLHRRRQSFLSRHNSATSEWETLLKELSLLVHGELVLEAVEISNMEMGPTAELRGYVTVAEPSAAHSILVDFFDALKQSAVIHRVHGPKVSLRPHGPTARVSLAREQPEDGGGSVSFIAECELAVPAGYHLSDQTSLIGDHETDEITSMTNAGSAERLVP